MKCIFAVGLLCLLTRGPSGGVSAQTLVEIINCRDIGGTTEVTLTATLDDSLSINCTLNPLTEAVFRLTMPGNTPSNLCTQSLASCDNTVQSGGCNCVSKTGHVWTFSQKFTFNPATQTGATLDLVPNCLPDQPYLSRTKCTNLQPTADVCAGFKCNNGTCYIDNGSAKCNCINGFIGPTCTGIPARNITCKRTANEGLCYKAVAVLSNLPYDPVCYECEQGYTGPDCRPCTFCRDWDDTCDTAGCLALIIVLCLFGPPIGGAGAAYFYLFVKEKKVELPVKNADKEKIKAFLRPVENKESIKVDYEQDNKVIITSKDYFNVKGANIFVRNNTSSSSNSTTGGNGKPETTEQPV